MDNLVFNVKREKGIYTFVETSTENKIVVNVPAHSISTTFKNLNALANERFMNFIYKKEVSTLFQELLGTACMSNNCQLNVHGWATIEAIDRTLSISELFPDLMIPIHYMDYIRSEKIPKGFIQYCIDNKKRFSNYTLTSFNRMKECETLPKSVRALAIKEHGIFGNTDYDRALRIKVLKLFINALNKDNNIDDCEEWANIILNYCSYSPQLIPLVRTTSSLYDIYRRVYYQYHFLKNEQYMEKMIKQQKKILEIESIESDNYCVVCPRNFDDLIDEGTQQNNCVGYFYNKNIANGEDYIYFIREKSNKKKSYITCRWNTKAAETVEYYYKNNEDVEDNPEAKELIERIDNYFPLLFE